MPWSGEYISQFFIFLSFKVESKVNGLNRAQKLLIGLLRTPRLSLVVSWMVVSFKPLLQIKKNIFFVYQDPLLLGRLFNRIPKKRSQQWSSTEVLFVNGSWIYQITRKTFETSLDVVSKKKKSDQMNVKMYPSFPEIPLQRNGGTTNENGNTTK